MATSKTPSLRPSFDTDVANGSGSDLTDVAAMAALVKAVPVVLEGTTPVDRAISTAGVAASGNPKPTSATPSGPTR